jgi:hypothetical protein
VLELQFIATRMTSSDPIPAKNTIMIHPFGRYCNANKLAGEVDTLEVLEHALQDYPIDPNRVAIRGFSMGGAAAWHLAVHYPDKWFAANPGAGFSETPQFLKVFQSEDLKPTWYEQKLWGVYDVPDCARNFFNVPLICYSGELDAQRDSAEYMTEVLGREGLKPPHLIGPGVGHKYHPETIKEVQGLIEAAVNQGRDPWPKKVTLQTRTLAYARMFWVSVGQFIQEWEDTRVDAEILDSEKVVRVTTKNVAMLQIRREESTQDYQVIIDMRKAEEAARRGGR